mmetsp:Transcript_106119/g.298339  ORF Transcript_106119/g.298339 Transcript_106119/m.298339 type:complete len:123 (+) Transcript_106119:58-426(+)
MLAGGGGRVPAMDLAVSPKLGQESSRPTARRWRLQRLSQKLRRRRRRRIRRHKLHRSRWREWEEPTRLQRGERPQCKRLWQKQRPHGPLSQQLQLQLWPGFKLFGAAPWLEKLRDDGGRPRY